MTTPRLEETLAELHTAGFGWALSCCDGVREEAEEVLQTSYLKVLEGRARFDGRSSAKTWFLGVVRRTAAERRRKLKWRELLWLGRPEAGPGSPGSPPPPATPEARAQHSEVAERVRRALRDLPRRQREVLHLVFYQDLTLAEAAVVLGVSLGSARTHYHRGKAGLRELLGRENHDG